MKAWKNVLALSLLGSFMAIGCVVSSGDDDDPDTNGNNNGSVDEDAGTTGSTNGSTSDGGNTGMTKMDASMGDVCEVAACDGTEEECSCYDCYSTACKAEFCDCYANPDCLDVDANGNPIGEFPVLLDCLAGVLEDEGFVDETSLGDCATQAAADSVALNDQTEALVSCMRKGVTPGDGGMADAAAALMEPQCNTVEAQQCPEIGDIPATQ